MHFIEYGMRIADIIRAFGAVTLLWLTAACHDLPEYTDDPRGNFEALWQIMDEHYCFFGSKDVDWAGVHDRYVAKVSDRMTSQELFRVCADMLGELRDGHTNLISPFETSYYRKWWSDYPQNYDARIVEQYYFNFNYRSVCGIDYGYLTPNVGYMHYGSFSDPVGSGNMDYILDFLATAQGLIIDVRDNGGGDLTNVETIVSHFIDREIKAGYIMHKTGPGHDDFSKPYAYYYKPASGGHIVWRKPVVVLMNRSTFSAANNFVAVMKHVPGVRLVGDVSGGGSGMPFNSELPNGWGVRFSACSILDAAGESTEQGVPPSDGCKVDMDPAEAMLGHDTMIDFAVELIRSGSFI